MRASDFLALVLLGFCASPSVAASYDCAKAATPDEKAVCASPRLSALDTLMGRAYAQARTRASGSERTRLLADARTFTARRGGCGTDEACLTAIYVGVIQDLVGEGADVAVPASVSALQMTEAVPAETHALPRREGACVTTRINAIGGRLEGDKAFESGTSVGFADGGSQVSYEKEPAIIQSRLGDRVLMCLTSIPKHCPPGDDRGRSYTTTNLRTHGTWFLPDSEHMCGGA